MCQRTYERKFSAMSSDNVAVFVADEIALYETALYFGTWITMAAACFSVGLCKAAYEVHGIIEVS
jgi:hypothetical protein